MKRIVLILAIICAAMAGAQTVTVTASNFGGSTPFTGIISWQPASADGKPVSVQLSGGGQTTVLPLKTYVTKGAFSITVPDVIVASPQSTCYRVTALLNGVNVLGPGYTCVQPHATAMSTGDWCQSGVCNFDAYVPNLAPVSLVGPRGAIGATGPQGPAGIGADTNCAANGSGGLNCKTVATVSVLPPLETYFDCEGDSITYGHLVTVTTNRFCDLAQNLPALSGRGYTYTNYAVSGSKIADLVARYTTNGVQTHCQTGSSILSVLIGTNDLPVGTAAASIFSAIATYWSQAKSDGCKVVAYTILPRSDSTWTATMEVQRKALNELIRASSIPNYFVDLDAIINNATDTTAFPDGLHPTDSVHARMAQLLNAGLQGTKVYAQTLNTTTVSPVYLNANYAGTGIDLNTMTSCGTYDGQNWVNGPTGFSTTWAHLAVLCQSTTPTGGKYALQMLTSFIGTTTLQVWVRYESGGTWNAWRQIGPESLSGVTASIGGTALAAGGCSWGTATVTGVTSTSQVPVAAPTTFPGAGFYWSAYASSANTVTVGVCAIVAGTPIASTYNVVVPVI